MYTSTVSTTPSRVSRVNPVPEPGRDHTPWPALTWSARAQPLPDVGYSPGTAVDCPAPVAPSAAWAGTSRPPEVDITAAPAPTPANRLSTARRATLFCVMADRFLHLKIANVITVSR